MTGKDVNDRLSTIIKDPEELRWKSTEKLLWINDAVNMIVSIRPDAMINTSGALITITPITALTAGAALSIADKWLPAVVQYAASLCFQDEGGNKGDLDRAKLHMDNFMSFVKAL